MRARAKRLISLASIVGAAIVASAWGAVVAACARTPAANDPDTPMPQTDEATPPPVTVVQVEAPIRPDASRPDAGVAEAPAPPEDAEPPRKPEPTNDKTLDYLPAE